MLHYVKTWSMRWDDILRDILYPDEELREQMLIPTDTNIVTWIDKYFVDASLCNDIVTDEDVRVLWYEDQSSSTRNPQVARRKISFDIYVKTDRDRDATNDILLSRRKLIAQRLVEILTLRDQVGRVAFMYGDDYTLGTTMAGYSRQHLSVTYLAGHP